MPKMEGVLKISEILNDYSEEVQELIIKNAEEVSKKGKEELKRTSPKRTGDYRKGWRVKETKGRGFVECVIHNATDYQLTHLLEKPHATRNGGKTTPKVHIAPVAESCSSEFETNVERAISNGI